MSDLANVSAPVSELDQRIRQLARLIDVGKSVAAQLDLEPLLQQVVDSATQLLEADMGGLLVLNENGTGIEFFKVTGWPFELSGTPTGNGILSLPYREKINLRSDNIGTHPKSTGFPSQHPAIGPFLAVPLLSKEKALGTLFLGNRPNGAIFTPEAEELLVAFATQATIAIENARLYAKVNELARIRERQRVAQALHDTMAQMLFSIGLETDWCMKNQADTEGVQQRLQTIGRLASHSSDQLRSAIFALRSQYLPGEKNGSLVQLIDAQVKEFESQSGIPAIFNAASCFPAFPPLVSEAVFRIVCESLNNVKKHASATGVMVSLDCDSDSVFVIVQDNGVGLAEPSRLEFMDGGLHFGVTTMRQVTAQAEGSLLITNNDDEGVMVRARFPIPKGDLS